MGLEQLLALTEQALTRAFGSRVLVQRLRLTLAQLLQQPGLDGVSQRLRDLNRGVVVLDLLLDLRDEHGLAGA
ncbi:MAG: hypothetical protein ACFCUP_10160 [Actinomycetales bacterium]